VTNKDYTGCEYLANIRQILLHKRDKWSRIEFIIWHMNKIELPYTEEYDMTAMGKLLHAMFMRLKERRGIFGLRIHDEVKTS
jgi:hypothetical protein